MRSRIGVALGGDRLTAAPAGRLRTQWSRQLVPLETGRGWSDLAAALQELRSEVGPATGALDVALLPPLVQLRRIELPRLADEEVRTVLSRDAGRYLLDPPPSPVVSAWTRAARRRSPVPYLVAFADTELVASIHAAAEQAGFRAPRVLPAHAAWEAAVRCRLGKSAQGRGALLVADGCRTEAIVFDGGRLEVCRRADTPVGAAEIVRTLGAEGEGAESTPWLACVASDTASQTLEAASTEAGMSLLILSDGDGTADTPASLAAGGVSHAAFGELLPEPIWQERWRRARGLSHRLLVGAAALLLLSAGLELWGAHRKLAALQAERRTLRPLVSQAMELRQSVDGVQDRLRGLTAAEAGASRWTAVIADVADHLPSDAHLLSLRGEGDSLVLEGVATKAAGVFESLRGAPGVVGVRAEAPIRQEARDSGAPVERFSLGARLAANARPQAGS